MIARRAAGIAALLVVATAIGAAARATMHTGEPSQEQGDERPGPDSGRVAALLAALGATDPMVCDMIGDQLGNFWSERGRNRVGAFSDAPAALGTARDSLNGRVRDRNAIALLVAHLKDDAACPRRVAAKLLGRSAIETPRLVALLDDASPRVREAAAYAIGVGERHDARGAIESRVISRDEPIAAMAAWALSEIHDGESLPAFERALGSSFVRVRIAAARGLGEVRNSSSRASLERVLRDGDAAVREAAIDALSELGDAQSASALTPMLSDRDRDVRIAAAHAFGEMHELRKAPRELADAAASKDAKLAEAAINALAEIHDPETLDVLAAQVSNPSREIRVHAVSALGEIRSPKALPALMKALKDPDAEVRRVAAEALGEIRER